MSVVGQIQRRASPRSPPLVHASWDMSGDPVRRPGLHSSHSTALGGGGCQHGAGSEQARAIEHSLVVGEAED